MLDRHTVQLRQLSEALAKQAPLAGRQSDNIGFLLAENVAIKDQLTALEHGARNIEVRITRLENEVAGLKKGLNSFKQGQAALTQG